MAHWNQPPEREDCDGHDETHDAVLNARKWLRGVADRSQNDFIRGITGDLRALELAGSQFYLGVEDDTDDRDDIDDVGPY